ncbi:MAG TPA: iron ABC transporter permease [Thermomicrobiaceae bacterium]|nr:iron ABC transporter permease [Thermomicrobiaceae bacterium]
MAARTTYGAITRRKALVLLSLMLMLLLAVLVDIARGPANLSFSDVAAAIRSPGAVDTATRVIVWDIRLPMALMAVLVGASLAIAGAEMQTILNNPLASPFTLGISASAGFGAALAIVLNVSLIPVAGTLLVAANAFVFAMLAATLIYLLSGLRGVTTETMILLGIALVFLFNALLSLLQYIASEQALQQVVFWSLGSLAKASWLKIGVVALVMLVTIPLFLGNVWKLTALRLGDETAASLGVNVSRLRLNVLVAVSLLAAVSVAFVGVIGFVGLVGPHMARMLVGEDQRYFLPASALGGALMLSVTSILSKAIVPGVILPIGIVSALIGVPFFLSLILTRRRQLW